jgi:hypothetical protein
MAEHAADARDLPASFPPWGGHLGRTEPFGHRREGAGGRRLGRPGQALRHDCRFDGIEGQAARGAGGIRGQDSPLGRHRSREQLTTAEFGLATAAHPVCHQRPCICGPGTTHLKEEGIVWGMTHGAFQALALTAMGRPCFPQQHLMPRVAGEAIWGSHEHACHRPRGDTIAEVVQARTVTRGPAVASVTEDVRLRQLPVGWTGHPRSQAGALRFNGLWLVWPMGGDSNLQGHFHQSGSPRWQGSMPATGRRPWRSLPSAAGAGTRGPSAGPHRVEPSRCA